ncbi:MAG: hypothetical protein ACWIPH_10090, partial [Ostreibacterium sp.]
MFQRASISTFVVDMDGDCQSSNFRVGLPADSIMLASTTANCALATLSPCLSSCSLNKLGRGSSQSSVTSQLPKRLSV